LKTILFILESDHLQTALWEELQKTHLVLSCSAEDATAKIRYQQPDAMILDLFLPGLDGFSILETLEFRPQVVIMLTPLVTQSILDTADQLGCRLILKPCTVKHILSQLKERMGE